MYVQELRNMQQLLDFASPQVWPHPLREADARNSNRGYTVVTKDEAQKLSPTLLTSIVREHPLLIIGSQPTDQEWTCGRIEGILGLSTEQEVQVHGRLFYLVLI